MKSICAITVIILYISCNSDDRIESMRLNPPNAKKVSLQLIDSLGIIELFVPIRYDTSFTWVDYSDCGKPCNKQKYRFQPQALRITKESGWIWLGEPADSIDRFTISHSGFFPFHEGDTAKNIARHNMVKGSVITEIEQPAIVFDTVQKVQDRYFYIIAIEKKDSLIRKKIVAVTTIKSNEIMFQYELVTKSNDSITENYISNALNLIKFVKIEKGQ